MFENIYILIPVYNEENKILDVISDLQSDFKNILVVDDGSSDNTPKIIKDLNVKVISHHINLGQGAAISSGFNYLKDNEACYALITFDADGQHQKEDAIAFAKEILKCKEDIIFGSRFIKNATNIPLIKRLVLKIAIKFTNIFSNMQLTDTHNGLVAFKKCILERINITIDGFGHASEIRHLVSKNKISYKEMPTNIIYTDYSKQKGQKILNGFLIIEDFLRSVGRK